MKLFECIKNFLFKKKSDKNPELRAKCVEAYGEEFGEMYDAINRGETIGGFLETAMFIEMIEAVRKGKPLKPKENNE